MKEQSLTRDSVYMFNFTTLSKIIHDTCNNHNGIRKRNYSKVDRINFQICFYTYKSLLGKYCEKETFPCESKNTSKNCHSFFGTVFYPPLMTFILHNTKLREAHQYMPQGHNLFIYLHLE